MSIGCIIQARISSTRLPEKVLKKLPYNSGETVLEQVIKRVRQIAGVDKIIIATTTQEEDLKIVSLAERVGVESFRGSLDHVLERYYLAAKNFQLSQIIRVTSDCPCLDPEVTSHILHSHLAGDYDYSSNSLQRTYPHGLDSEVFTFSALEEAFKNATEKYEKEHVTPYIYKSNPQKFKLNLVLAPDHQKAPDIRITLDTPDDYALLCAVYDLLYTQNPEFKVQDLINLFKSKPWLYLINGDILQKKYYESIYSEAIDAIPLLDRQELFRISNFIKEKILKAALPDGQ